MILMIKGSRDMFRGTTISSKRLNMMNMVIFSGVLTLLFILALSACTAAKGNILILEDGQGTGFTMTLKQYTSMNKCELSLAKGDVLQVEIDREEGQISFTVSGKNGSEPYAGNDLQTGIFTITVSETDEYVFRVNGKAATGKIVVRAISNR